MYLRLLVFIANLGSRARSVLAEKYPDRVYWGYKRNYSFMPLEKTRDEVVYRIY